MNADRFAIARPSNERQLGSGPTCRRGFSLLELVTVLAIVAIIAAVAAPRFGRAAARYHVDVAARRVVQDFAYASRQARNAASGRTVAFNVGAGRYTVSGVAGLVRAADVYTVELGAEPYRSTVDSADFGGSLSVTFDAYGQPDSGGKVVLTAGEFTRTITLDANSGKATIE